MAHQPVPLLTSLSAPAVRGALVGTGTAVIWALAGQLADLQQARDPQEVSAGLISYMSVWVATGVAASVLGGLLMAALMRLPRPWLVTITGLLFSWIAVMTAFVASAWASNLASYDSVLTAMRVGGTVVAYSLATVLVTKHTERSRQRPDGPRASS